MKEWIVHKEKLNGEERFDFTHKKQAQHFATGTLDQVFTSNGCIPYLRLENKYGFYFKVKTQDRCFPFFKKNTTPIRRRSFSFEIEFCVNNDFDVNLYNNKIKETPANKHHVTNDNQHYSWKMSDYTGMLIMTILNQIFPFSEAMQNATVRFFYNDLDHEEAIKFKKQLEEQTILEVKEYPYRDIVKNPAKLDYFFRLSSLMHVDDANGNVDRAAQNLLKVKM